MPRRSLPAEQRNWSDAHAPAYRQRGSDSATRILDRLSSQRFPTTILGEYTAIYFKNGTLFGVTILAMSRKMAFGTPGKGRSRWLLTNAMIVVPVEGM